MSQTIFSSTNNVVSSRIKEARLSRGLSVSDLAEHINVSRQMISRYESGDAQPSAEVFSKIIDTLNFPLSFFMRVEIPQDSEKGPVFFRSLTKTKSTTREMIKSKILWTNQAFCFIKKYMDVPELNLPIFKSLTHKENYTVDDIEGAANELRKYWQVGSGPIDNLTLLIEKNGFVISYFCSDDMDADACSQTLGKKHYIMINRKQPSAVRERFDLAHELAHRILHFDIDQEMISDKADLKRIEKEAHRFAAAFLMPKETFPREVFSTSLNHFLILKKRWKVSVAAMLYRCADLELLTEDQVLNIRKQISFRGWTKKEPLDEVILKERPYLLRQSFELIVEKKVELLQNIIDYFSWMPSDLEDIFCLERNSLTQNSKIVQFR